MDRHLFSAPRYIKLSLLVLSFALYLTGNTTQAQTGSGGVIYGGDDRVDIFTVTDPDILRLARASCAIILGSDIRNNTDGTYTIFGPSYGPANNLCTDEPFWGQPAIAYCSGVLVGGDIVATAGHCLNAPQCDDKAYIFGYVMTDSSTPVLNFQAEDVYFCGNVIGRVVDSSDWALVQLDRPVTTRTPVNIRYRGNVPDNAPLLMIGHPSGLPQKVAGGATVRDNSAPDYFISNLDAYHVNSGSPVFNAPTLELEGILVRGQPDFVSRGNCNISNQCLDDLSSCMAIAGTSPIGERVTRATIFLGAGAPPALTSPRVEPSSGRSTTPFAYRVHYLDPDGRGRTPIISNVAIDGIYHSMTLESGSPDDGTYVYRTILPVGSHNYFFFFRDPTGGSALTPIFPGPPVGLTPGLIPVQFYFGGGGGVPVNDCFDVCYSVNSGEVQRIRGSQLPYPGVTKLVQVPGTLRLEGCPLSDNHAFREWEVYCDGNKVAASTATVIELSITTCAELVVVSYWNYTPRAFTISGVVSDQNGPITNATLNLNGQLLSTASDGLYAFQGVQGGQAYTITIGHPDYSFVPPSITFNCLNQHTTFNFKGISLDSQRPQIRFVSLPPRYVTDTNKISFTWVGTDNRTTQNAIKYRYRLLHSSNESWSDWTTTTGVNYDLPNGAYVFQLAAMDEAGNQPLSGLQHTFAVSFAPRIEQSEALSDGIWLTKLTLHTPSGGIGPFDKVVLLSAQLNLPDDQFVPVRLLQNPDREQLGTVSYATEELGLSSVFIEVENGFIFTLPSPMTAEESREYIIQWGKLIQLGWQDRVAAPPVLGIDPSGATPTYYLDTYLDKNLQLWRLWSKVVYGVRGFTATSNASVYVQVINRDGSIIAERDIDFKAADFYRDPNSSESSPRYFGTSWQFESLGSNGGSFVETETQLWLFWGVIEYTFKPPELRDISKKGFAFQRFDKLTLLPVGEPVYSEYTERQLYLYPALAPDDMIWLQKSSDNSRQISYQTINSSGVINNPPTVVVNVPQGLTNATYIEVYGPLFAPNGNAWFFLNSRWDASPTNSYARDELSFKVLNSNGTVHVPETVIAQASATPNVRREDQRAFNGRPVLDHEGKAWVSFTAKPPDTPATFYYSIFSPSGAPLPGKENLRTQDRRVFHFVDSSNYIWSAESHVLQILKADDTPAEPSRPENTLVPGQHLGVRAARAEPDYYQLFDRWSTQSIELNLSEGMSIGSIEILDVDKFRQQAHVENLVISTAGQEILRIPGIIPSRSEYRLDNPISQRAGINFTQTGLLGGELLVTFTPGTDLPFVRGDANDDGHHDISDPLFILLYLFVHNVSPHCEESLDANDDSKVDVSDPIYLLNWRFRHGDQPPVQPSAPFPACAPDPTDDELTCKRFQSCQK